MRKIDKRIDRILSHKYRGWLNKLESEENIHPPTYRYYYDDIAMSLYKCQQGVCAYTEMYICIPDLYSEENWDKGHFSISNKTNCKRNDHFGEMDLFDPQLKKDKYWLWSNLFMIHSSINSIKRNAAVIAYLKPDLDDYSPEKYFDYDETTHRFVPNTDIEDGETRDEIQYMIDKVLCLNHGIVQRERRDYISLLKQKMQHNQHFEVDRFFTAVSFCQLL